MTVSKFIIYTILLLVLTFIQVSILSFISKIELVNFVLITAIFIIVEKRSPRVWYLCIIAGLLLDLYSPLPFGVITSLTVIICAVVALFSQMFFTNRSIYSLIFLTLIGSFIFKFILIMISRWFGYRFLDWQQFFACVLFALGVEIVYSVALYILNLSSSSRSHV